VLELLADAGVETSGARITVVGRSNLVGRPLANMLTLKGRDATVTIAHSRTRDLGAVCREADVVVAAAGQRGLITADMVSPGAVVIDVGTNRGDDGGLVGDVDFDGVAEVAGAITPVPGGVGPMTRAMLLQNTLEAARARRGACLDAPDGCNRLGEHAASHHAGIHLPERHLHGSTSRRDPVVLPGHPRPDRVRVRQPQRGVVHRSRWR
jgi:hypothetical protein